MKEKEKDNMSALNDALASELLRKSSEVTRLEGELRAERELRETKCKELDEVTQQKQEGDLYHLSRSREIQKRFKIEHTGRILAETELATLRENRANMEQKLHSLDAERVRLQEALTEAVGTRGRLEAQGETALDP